MRKSRKSKIKKFEFYETTTDSGIESGYIRLANTQFHTDAVMDLSANSYRVFTYMKFRAKGGKAFTYTYANAIKDASISRQTFLKVKRELLDDEWVQARMEMNPAREWYLVGTPYCGDLEYIRARIPG